ncbi:MAG: OmpA/MotB family protein [Peptostreptococcaceae bacterium]
MKELALMRRRKIEEEEIDSNSWLATYSDTITLLLTFFILLYSFSETNNEKLIEVSNALQSQLVGTPISTNDSTNHLTGVITPPPNEKTEYENLVEKVNVILNSNGLEDVVGVREEEKGVVLQLSESILFDPAKADLKKGSLKILDAISTILPQLENEIMIQGHTDNVPINSEKYPSNWELSTARAVNVLRYFVEEKGFDPTRFSATGYGEYSPLVENINTENKSINRRVDLLIVQQKEKSE